jgi:prephenate dehydrogenase
LFKRIAIIGLGLIGGSLGLAIKDAHPGAEVWGVDQTQEVITKAREMGAIDGGTLDLGQSVKGAELVIIATPLGVIEEILIKVAPHLQKGAIVTDVGSTKQKVVQWMETLLPPGVEGVGGHPMAGSEKSSVLGATANLLVQAPYILTPTPKNKEETMEKLRGFFSS